MAQPSPPPPPPPSPPPPPPPPPPPTTTTQRINQTMCAVILGFRRFVHKTSLFRRRLRAKRQKWALSSRR
eukprot:4997178-Prymnesium_polylepis.1